MSALTDQDRANIHRVLVDWVHGWLHGDAWLATRAYRNDAVLVDARGACHRGRSAIEAALRSDAGAGLQDVPADLDRLEVLDEDTVVVTNLDANAYPLARGAEGCWHHRVLRRDGFLWTVASHALGARSA